jgi:periplasmic protein TonB
MSSLAINQTSPSLPRHRRQSAQQGVDVKRIAAIACVLVLHVLVLGALSLPKPPMYQDLPMSPTEPLLVELTPPPPMPERVVEIEREKNKPNTETLTVPLTAPTAAPVIDTPVQVATISEPAEEQGTFTASMIVEPPTPVGGSIAEAVMELVSAPPPLYPPPELRKGIEGTVKFRVLVNTEGRVKEIELVSSSGNRNLDRSALTHVKRKWKFKPASVDGSAQQTWGQSSVVFRIDG